MPVGRAKATWPSRLATPQAAMTERVLQTALLLGSAAFAIAFVVLFNWVLEPVLDARRLSNVPDDTQEQSYEDPKASKPKARTLPFGSLADPSTLSLSVILPAYNEEDRITVTLRDTVAYLDERKKQEPGFTYEIIVVDDCSTDKTVQVVLNEIKTVTVARIKLLRLKENHGKGGAVRKGVMRALGERVLFADADNATEIRDLAKLDKAMTDALATSAPNGGVIVCGSRAHLEEQAIAKRNPLRNVLMHGFHFIVSTLCVRNVRDTQCGFKLFDRTAARLVFPPMHIERWAFDVELLYVAAIHKLAIREVAVQWHEVPGSKLSVVSASLSMLRELVLIRLCYTFGVWKTQDGGFRLRRDGVSVPRA